MCQYAYFNYPACSHEILVPAEFCEAALEKNVACEPPAIEHPHYNRDGVCQPCQQAPPQPDTISEISERSENTGRATLGAHVWEGQTAGQARAQWPPGEGLRAEHEEASDDSDEDDEGDDHDDASTHSAQTAAIGPEQTQAAVQEALRTASNPQEYADIMHALQETRLHASPEDEERQLQEALRLSLQDHESEAEKQWQQEAEHALQRSRQEYEESHGAYANDKEAVMRAMVESGFSAANDRRRRLAQQGSADESGAGFAASGSGTYNQPGPSRR